MKILHVNKFFDLQGGAEVYMHGLMHQQELMGHEVHAFSTKSHKNLPSQDQKHFVTRYDLTKRHDPVTDIKIAANYLYNLEAKKAFASMLDEVKPDVVHLHNLYNYLSSSLLGEIRKRNIPCVQTLHDYKLACPNYKMYTEGAVCERCKGGKYYESIKHRCSFEGLLPNVLAAAEMYLTKTVQAYEKTVSFFLCPSQFIKEKMIDWGEPASKMRLVRNPTDEISEPALRGGGYLLYSGRLSPEKGLKSFLEAACKFPQLPVKIAGRGPEEAELRKLVAEKGAHHIEFLGFVAPADLIAIRHRAEALVLPTLMYENCSGSVLEGLASGLPCLVTRIGGNPELVEDGKQGFLVTPGDVEDWVRILHRFMATTKEMRDAMAHSAREKIHTRHRWQTHTEGVLQAYRDAGVRV